jgi:hypothetical protein
MAERAQLLQPGDLVDGRLQLVGHGIVDVAPQEDDDLARTPVGDLNFTHGSHLRDSNVTGIMALGNGFHGAI